MYKQDLALNNLQGLICHKKSNLHMQKETITMSFTIQGFLTIVYTLTTFGPLCLRAFFRCYLKIDMYRYMNRCREPTQNFETLTLSHSWRWPNLITLTIFCNLPAGRIEPATTGWLLLRLSLVKTTPITVTPYVLLDSSERIFRIYKLHVLTSLWINTFLCMIFFTWAHIMIKKMLTLVSGCS